MGFSSRATVVLVTGALVLTIAMGIRQTFGLFLPPLSLDLGISRESFGFAMAVQNLLWGVLQPVCGMIADRYGARRVVIAGAVLYMAGLLTMSDAEGAFGLTLGGGVLVGMAMSCVSFAVVLGSIGRVVAPERRSMALGIASAGGSFGQFVMAPVGQQLISQLGWSQAFVVMAVLAALLAPLALCLSSSPQSEDRPSAGTNRPGQSLREALGEASRNAGYWYLTVGFLVCGFQVVFIAVHLPAYLADLGLSPDTGAMALALIGLFNIIGTWACGALGDRYPKKYLLATLYALRALVIAVFVAAPKTETTVLVFAAAMGVLWLGTVPLTSGLVAHMFGVRYMSTLFGFVFFSHQLGSFLGVWLGGAVYDMTGSYDVIWQASIVLGLIAAALHLPIPERPLRTAEA